MNRRNVPQELDALGWYASGSRDADPLLAMIQGARASIEVANAALGDANVALVLDGAVRQLDAAEVLFGRIREWALTKIPEGSKECPYVPQAKGRRGRK